MRALMNRLLGRSNTCPVPRACPPSTNRRRLVRLSLPLISFVVPTVVMAYRVLIPGSCIAGFNALTFGFGTTVLGTCVTYFIGIRAARRA